MSAGVVAKISFYYYSTTEQIVFRVHETCGKLKTLRHKMNLLSFTN